MMDSKLKDQDDGLLQELKKLRAENELLEKHVFVLNECLSINELKEKISMLEKKKEQLNSLEEMIGRLRAEIEPLQYLKSVLEGKLVNQNKTITNKSLACTDLNSICMDHLNELNTDCKTSQSQNSKNIPADLVLSQNSHDDLLNTPTNSISFVNEGSFDECMQLLDQYDVVTDLEISNFPSEDHSKIQYITEEHTINDVKIDIDNGEQGKQLSMTNTYFEPETAGAINMPLNNEEIEPIKIEEKSNGSLKNVNNNTNMLLANEHIKQNKTSDKEDNLSLITLEKETTNTNKSTDNAELMEHIEMANPNNSKTNINTFNDMNLKIDLLRGIYSLGFINPTTLQKQVIVNCLNGRDVIVFAGPGNGKIMTFTIPLLQRINTNINECQALVLVPTRDLAVHIQKIIMSVGDFLDVNVCIGGDNVPKKLSIVPHVIVGTPDGVCKMIECKSLYTGYIQTVVINKIDKMLNDGFTKLIKQIIEKLEKNKQVTLLTSEKLDYVLDMYMDFLLDPLVIINENENDVIKSLPKQFYLKVQEEWKLNALCEINETLKMERVIIFCNTLDRAQTLFESLMKLEYSVSLFHLEMSAYDREIKLNMFSINHLQMLITTEPIKSNQFQYAAWIINYDLPSNPICYLNRIKNCTNQARVLNIINENEDNTKMIIETYNKSYMIQAPMNMLDILQF